MTSRYEVCIRVLGIGNALFPTPQQFMDYLGGQLNIFITSENAGKADRSFWNVAGPQRVALISVTVEMRPNLRWQAIEDAVIATLRHFHVFDGTLMMITATEIVETAHQSAFWPISYKP